MSSTPPKAVAIVDDDPGMRTSLNRFLSSFGYVTHVYESSEAFLSVAAATTAECLVLDIQLGGISGIELARQLAAIDLKVPIVFMTALDSEVIRNQAEQLGCVAFLHKPFRSDLLIQAIVGAIGQPC